MRFLKEENGVYAINVEKAAWATDKVNELYHNAGVQLKDVDFLIETSDKSRLIAVEYKNASIPKALKYNQFNPADDKYVNAVAHKFYDTLHFLYLTKRMQPVSYVYIVEYPNGDVVTRLRLRERIRKGLPFKLQSTYEEKLIESFDVLSIKEWNERKEFCDFPIVKLEEN